MIYTIAIFVAFFLALIILTKKGRNLADIILGIWLIVIGIHCGLFYLYHTGMVFRYPHLLGANIPFPYLHGPLLLLYTQALTRPESFKSRRWALHLVLPVLITLPFLSFYLSSAEQKTFFCQNNGTGYEMQISLWNIVLNISGIFYVVITYRLLHAHKKRILSQFSNQEKINLNWLRFLFYSMAIIWFIIIFIQGDENIFPAATIFIFLIGYFGIKQVGIFTNQKEEIPVFAAAMPPEASLSEKKKYLKSGLRTEDIQTLHGRLTQLMASEKCYTDPELTLSDLAGRLDIHANYLSQVINEMEGVTFYDYVNAMRIEEFIRLAQNPDNQKFTLLSLAYECGFNSKTAFNRNFKKMTNCAPSDYIRQLETPFQAMKPVTTVR